MSAAAAAADAPAPKGKKKLLIMIVAAVLVLAVGGVGAMLMLKKGQGDDEEADSAPARHAVKARDPAHPPVFAPLDPFTVNLADKESERYAQIGITLELDEAHTADTLKTFMPAVRNNILMLLAHKTSEELLQRDGKEKLAKDVAREASRGLGVEVEDEDEADEDASAKSKKKKKKRAAPELPVRAVYFSTFIIQ